MKEEKKGKSSEEKLFNDIAELEEKILELKDLGEVEIAESFQPIVDDLKKKYKANNHISNDLIKDIYKVMDYLNFEIDLQYQFIGIIRETKLISERYNEKIEEFEKDFEEKSIDELWIGIKEIAEGLKIYSDGNPRLKAHQFNKIIAKQVLKNLIIQARRIGRIDLHQVEELCSKEDLINVVKDMLIEISENAEEKDELLDMAEYLDEKSLENPEIWQLLSGMKEVKFVERKEEIETSKPKGILPKYEGLGLKKLGFSVYTLGDINEDGEWVNVRKEYGKFPRDFGDENDRVLQIEINGVSEINCRLNKYCNLQSVIIGKSVKKLGDDAFRDCKNLKNVELGKNLKVIGGGCFEGAESLESIEILDNVEEIGSFAFQNCKKLKNIVIGEGVKKILKNCFSDSGLESITIPDNVEYIGFHVFQNCKNLKTVVIGKGLNDIEGWSNIGGWCFNGCEDLTIIIPEGVKIHGFSLGDCNPKIITLTEEQMRKYKRRDAKIPETTFLKKSIKDDKDSNGSKKSWWENISDDIKDLEEKVRKLYYLKQTTLANSYKARVDELRRKYTEVLNSEDIIFGFDMDSQILDELFALKYELDDYLNGEGKVLENRRIGERYYKKIEEILTNLDEKSTEKLWAETRRIAEELKFDCERNPRLEAQQFNRIIAKLIFQILRIQAKRGEEIDLPQAKEVCGKDDLLCMIKDKLIEMSKQEESEVKKEKYLDTARYLDEKSLQNPEVWQILSSVQEVKFVGVEEKKPKKEIEIKKPRFCLPQIKYEGLGLEKFPWISVYTLGDIDEKTGEWINVEKKYGSFPRDFGDENDRVLEIEIKGVEEVRYSTDYRNLRKVILGDSVKCIGAEVFEGLYFLEDVELGEGIEHIGHCCFSDTALKKIYLPSSIKTIYPLAFSGCKKLETIEIGEGKKEISNDAFWSTPAWLNGNVKISDNTEIIGDFSIFTLGEVDLETGERKNVRRVLGRLDEFPQYSDQVLEIEINDVNEINEDHQLKDYPNLERVVLRESVKEIGEGAFSDCSRLAKVELGRRINIIPSECFARNISLTNVTYQTKLNLLYISKDAFLDCSQTVLIVNPNCIGGKRVTKNGRTIKDSFFWNEQSFERSLDDD